MSASPQNRAVKHMCGGADLVPRVTELTGPEQVAALLEPAEDRLLMLPH